MFLQIIAMDVLTKTYPARPLPGHSELVRRCNFSATRTRTNFYSSYCFCRSFFAYTIKREEQDYEDISECQP